MEQRITIAKALEVALEHHRAGRLDNAEAIYRHILSQAPKCSDALHLFGVLASQKNRLDIAVELIQQAIALQPGTAEYHFNLGGILRNLRRYPEAINHLRRTVEINPKMSGAYAN